MCELGIFDPFGSNLCAPGSTNMQNQLFMAGIGGLSGKFWSSTESSTVGIFAWNREYAIPSSQLLNGKSSPFGVRCTRYLAN
jgi:hypothetical protein